MARMVERFNSDSLADIIDKLQKHFGARLVHPVEKTDGIADLFINYDICGMTEKRICTVELMFDKDRSEWSISGWMWNPDLRP